jgi:peptidyl-prolyl cis-trans isomerase B (cyclophilin B)
MKLFLNQIGITSIAILLATATCNNTISESDGTETESTTMATAADVIAATAADSTGITKDDTVTMVTTMGTIKLRLYKETPKHQANFVKLCKSGFYNNVLFHRVINQFMIQSGDPESKAAVPGQMYGSGGPGYTIPAEFNSTFRHKRGALAAARQGDQVNPMKESSGSQFYICHGSPFQLDNDYTIFGETIEGIEVVDKIATTPCDGNDRPLKDVKIISTTVASDKGAKSAEVKKDDKKSDKKDTAKTTKGKSSKTSKAKTSK